MTNELMSKIAMMEPKMMKSVIHMRELHSCLMELDKSEIRDLQRKATLINYLLGEGRKRDPVPHTYRVPDGKGGYYEKETYFTYLNKVK